MRRGAPAQGDGAPCVWLDRQVRARGLILVGAVAIAVSPWLTWYSSTAVYELRGVGASSYAHVADSGGPVVRWDLWGLTRVMDIQVLVTAVVAGLVAAVVAHRRTGTPTPVLLVVAGLLVGDGLLAAGFLDPGSGGGTFRNHGAQLALAGAALAIVGALRDVALPGRAGTLGRSVLGVGGLVLLGSALAGGFGAALWDGVHVLNAEAAVLALGVVATATGRGTDGPAVVLGIAGGAFALAAGLEALHGNFHEGGHSDDTVLVAAVAPLLLLGSLLCVSAARRPARVRAC